MSERTPEDEENLPIPGRQTTLAMVGFHERAHLHDSEAVKCWMKLSEIRARMPQHARTEHIS